MRRDVVILWLAMFLAVFAALPSQSAADLGCSSNGTVRFATCMIDADCAPVGGVACTSGLCLCNEGSLTPLCACTEPHTAPVMSPAVLILLIGGLTVLAAFQLLRRGGARKSG